IATPNLHDLACQVADPPPDGGRFAPRVICFCSDRPHTNMGGQSGKAWFKRCRRKRRERGDSPSSLPSPPPRGEAETGGGRRGEPGTAGRRLRPTYRCQPVAARVAATPGPPAKKTPLLSCLSCI